jgi:hypothetical protein
MVSKKNRARTIHDRIPGLARLELTMNMAEAKTRVITFASQQRVLTRRSLPASLIKIKFKKLIKMRTKPPLRNQREL